ncbi:GAF domain-containing protein [Comamonas granuli]|uniref:GAF domain-containing protein n=1 Tax=Comamonas granuli TaxID=290309 RepID=UPI0005AA9737|nr:GAF domain-containing protein [Comamonas granuli]
MTAPSLHSIRPCLEGAIPAVMATCASDGTPNVAYISQVVYVDEGHVALSFQFFNKTRANILAHPQASVLVLDPVTARFYRLHLRYLRTETHGPLFESMKARLAGIASHSGMAEVFRLKGSDVYAVEHIDAIDGEGLPPPPCRTGLLHRLRQCSERMAACTGLDELLQTALACLREALGIAHAMVLLLDAPAQRLYTVASCGYATSGVGSEIALGHGVIGVAARENTPVRINHMAHAALYSHAMRSSLQAGSADGPALAPGTEIPYPGLPEPHSQLAVPMVAAGRVLGVLFVESARDMAFDFEDEDLLVALAGHLGAAIDLLQAAPDSSEAPPAPAAAPAPAVGGAPVRVRHYASNDSIFIDGDYLIKGVAGAIFWKLLRDYTQAGRTDFTNRELRLDPSIRLPDVADNLEARLLLLQRRLQENAPPMRIEKTGRGRLRLCVACPVLLEEQAG